MGDKYSYWLENVEGLYSADKRRLVGAFGSAREVLHAKTGEIMSIMTGTSLTDNNSGRDIGISIEATDASPNESIVLYKRYKKERVKDKNDPGYRELKAVERAQILIEAIRSVEDEDKLDSGWREFTSRGLFFYDITDRDYPEKLRNINSPPFGLYVKGTLPGNGPTVAVVGSRRISSYGRRLAQELGAALAERGIPVISGMARGCDSITQEAVVSAGGYTAAVLACGVDVCYPGELAGLYADIGKTGCIISELPCGTRPQPTFFPSRNRIISGLCDILVVIEAAEQSGSLITADFALDQGKDIYACPGRIGDVMSNGCNRLIAQGAGIITSVYDFMEASGLAEYYAEASSVSVNHGCDENREKACLNTNEQLVMDALDDYPKSISEIKSNLELPLNVVVSTLTGLEIRGMVRKQGSGYYSRY